MEIMEKDKQYTYSRVMGELDMLIGQLIILYT